MRAKEKGARCSYRVWLMFGGGGVWWDWVQVTCRVYVHPLQVYNPVLQVSRAAASGRSEALAVEPFGTGANLAVGPVTAHGTHAAVAAAHAAAVAKAKVPSYPL